jgi:1-acyl-sn-glycerol-3-phosphate acyltransferase
MRAIKLIAVVSLWGFFFALVALAHLWITILRLPNRWRMISRLTRNFTSLLRTLLNIKVTVAGDEEAVKRGGYVIISNHVSYVDGIVLGSIFPIVFVSKNEVKSWPIVGHWNRLCGTIFINRQRKEKVPSVVEEMTQRLKQEANILLFPEGTSTNGERMLPFQTVPLAAPLRSRSVIVPVTLAYTSIEEKPVTVANRDLVYWYGDMEFLPHVWRLMSLRGIEALVTIRPSIECFRYENNSTGRKKLAQDCYNSVSGRAPANDRIQEEAGGSIAAGSRLFSG